MDPQFPESLGILRKAYDTLSSELEWRARANVRDEHGLRRLGELARSFRQQAHSLLVAMAYQEAPEALREEAGELVGLFGCIVSQADAMLDPDKRVH